MSCPLWLRHVAMMTIPKNRLLSSKINRSMSKSFSGLASANPRLRLNAATAISFHLQFKQRRHYAERVIKVPDMAESISEGTLKQWSKAVGDFVERDEEIATIETDKIDVSVNAPEAGTLTELLAQEDETVTVGQDLAKLEPGGRSNEARGTEKKVESNESASDQQKASSESSSQSEGQSFNAASSDTNSTVNSERENDVQHSSEKESTKHQNLEHKKSSSSNKQPDKDHALSTSSGHREERRVKMNRMRLRIAERLKQSQNTAASLTTFQKVDMHALMEFRKMYKEDVLKNTGVKLGFMSAFTRASILAMKDIPAVNASIEGPGSGDTIVYRDYVDVSVAVATEKGLVTPVVRNAESLDMIGIERSIADLGKKARDNKLTIEDMAGGTFTISNGGVFGSLFGTPIINLPQTAVLGLHAINDEVVVINGKFEARPIMYLALTYDHRLLDGREAVTFLVKIKEYIQDPRKMLLG